MSRFCNLFGSLPDFHSFHLKSTERDVVSPCICQVWWALFSILITVSPFLWMMPEKNETWLWMSTLGNIFAIFGILDMLFCAFTQYPFYPIANFFLKKLFLQDLLFENLKKKCYVTVFFFFRLLLVERLLSRTIWVSWDTQS